MDYWKFAFETIKKNPGAWILVNLVYYFCPFSSLICSLNFHRMIGKCVAEDRAPTVGELFNGDTMGDDAVTILSMLAANFLAALCCVFPFYYVSQIIVFTPLTGSENKITGWSAVKANFAWGKGKWWYCFSTMFIIVFMTQLTIYACGAGILIMFPLIFISQWKWYQDVREDIYAAAAAEGIA